MAKYFRHENNVFICSTCPFPQWNWSLFFLFLICLDIMKCELFWMPSSDHSDSHKTKLVVLITDSPVEASSIWTPCWLIAVVKLPTQPTNSLPAPVLVRTHQLWKRRQVWSTIEMDTEPTWTRWLCKEGEQPSPATAAGTAHLHGTMPRASWKIRYLPVG